MRRTVTFLLVLTLVLAATAVTGCSGRNLCPSYCQPERTYEYVVEEHCFPIDRNGNPVYRTR